ncbi:hypothetical protein HELRODRAFT_180572 [Helobdella robusta]|uniref:Ig-like domain-containing protein n=1 Tax=Helobdella robusta TaxID=6412 RepID=T1FG22_HELRO|nr:hypothetical protein HELRODRAFT_180572 [Helobdella robusta]ESN93708.1 hypothetical protein HELRODRAFT_180572 [Helobdella robusta]
MRESAIIRTTKQQQQLEYIGDDKITKIITVQEGGDLKITCPVDLNTVNEILWLKDHKAILTRLVDGLKPTRTYRVRSVAVEDGGMYTCKATNGFGANYFHIFVYVYGE